MKTATEQRTSWGAKELALGRWGGDAGVETARRERQCVDLAPANQRSGGTVHCWNVRRDNLHAPKPRRVSDKPCLISSLLGLCRLRLRFVVRFLLDVTWMWPVNTDAKAERMKDGDNADLGRHSAFFPRLSVSAPPRAPVWT